MKDQQIAQNANANEPSKTRKRIKLRAKFFKNEYFEAESTKINPSAINREPTLKPVPAKCPPEKIFDRFKKYFNPANLADSVTPK